jgi:hypothetical protein
MTKEILTHRALIWLLNIKFRHVKPDMLFSGTNLQEILKKVMFCPYMFFTSKIKKPSFMIEGFRVNIKVF